MYTHRGNGTLGVRTGPTSTNTNTNTGRLSGAAASGVARVKFDAHVKVTGYVFYKVRLNIAL